MKIRKSTLKEAIREVLSEGPFTKDGWDKGRRGSKTDVPMNKDSEYTGKRLKAKPVWVSEPDNDDEMGVVIQRPTKGGDRFLMLVIGGDKIVTQDWGAHPSLNGAKKMLQKKLAM
tara:strand:+ start:2159 stop:2503 length:345 start_codon:yes stop_codon:yes gene_type:complete